ncbi:MAG: winged helix-turn-helix transcriptional regulator [Acidimicrobiales bacterium]
MATTQKVSPDHVLDTLAAHPRATSAALAEVLGIGQSTAAKHLATLEAAGTAAREPGGREGGRRVADRWHTTASAPEAAVSDDSEAAPDETVADGPARSADRLGRGALGSLVREYLTARPDEDLGPTQIGKALGRSQGAVSNALGRLEASGEAKLVSASPRRYRIVASR